MSDHRIEKDSMGEMQVPANALWGASTQRAVINFPVSGRPIAPELTRALGLVKLAAARVNNKLGDLDAELAGSVEAAALEVGTADHPAREPGLPGHAPRLSGQARRRKFVARRIGEIACQVLRLGAEEAFPGTGPQLGYAIRAVEEQGRGGIRTLACAPLALALETVVAVGTEYGALGQGLGTIFRSQSPGAGRQNDQATEFAFSSLGSRAARKAPNPFGVDFPSRSHAQQENAAD